jgi:proteic killer suppression protein
MGVNMIKTFKCKHTKALFDRESGYKSKWKGIERTAVRKLKMLNDANSLYDLTIPPSNQLHALKGDREGQHAIRINAQYRVCFLWSNGQAESVEIVDYH